jgi:Putative beta-lactamase-inhibitor-like, PepSY-like
MKLFLQLAGALAFCWLASACSKDSFLTGNSLTDSTTTLSTDLGVSERGDTIRTPILFKDLPEAARTFLLKKDTANIEKIFKITLPNGTVLYSVHFEDHHPLRFDATGKLIGGDKGGKGGKGGPRPDGVKIAFKDLPATAKTYLLANTDTSKIRHITKITSPDGKTGYVVVLEGGKVLHFDADGKLVAPPDRPVRPGHGPDGAKTAFKDLPAAAQTYLLANTDTSKIRHIVKITLPDGKTGYVVTLEGGKVIRFDADGKLMAAPVTTPTLTTIKVTDLPAGAQTALKDKKLLDKVEKVTKVTLPDGKVFYTVDIKGSRPLFFDADGKPVAGIPGGGGPGEGPRRPR